MVTHLLLQGWWLLPLLTPAAPADISLTDVDPVYRDLGRFQTLRYVALWDVTLNLEVEAQDDLGLFLHILDEDGALSREDTDGEASDFCQLAVPLRRGEKIRIRVGSTDADETGRLTLRCRETPDLEAWRAEDPPEQARTPTSTERETLRELTQELDQARDLLGSGRSLEASSSLRQLVTELEQRPSLHDLQDLVQLARSAGALCTRTQDTQTSVRFFRLGSQVADRIWKAADPTRWNLHAILGGELLLLTDLEHAEAEIVPAYSALERLITSNNVMLHLAGSGLVRMLTDRGRLKEARHVCEQLLDQVGPRFPNARVWRRAHLEDLAGVLRQEGSLLECRRVWREMLADLDPDDPEQRVKSWIARNNLALAVQGLGDYAQALALAESVFAEGELYLPSDSPLLMTFRVSLATLLLGDGEWARAATLLETVLESRPSRQARTDALLVLSSLYLAEGDLEKIETWLDHAEGFFTASESFPLSVVQLMRSFLDLRDADYSSAVSRRKDLLQAWYQLFPPPNRSLAFAHLWLAEAQRAAGDAQAAREQVREAWTQTLDFLSLPALSEEERERRLMASTWELGKVLGEFRDDPPFQLEVTMFSRTASATGPRVLMGSRSQTTAAEIAAALEEGALAVSLIRCSVQAGSPEQRQAYYRALIVNQHGEVKACDLAPLPEVERVAEAWLGDLTGEAGLHLSRLICEPLGPFLADIDKVYLAPESALASIPWDLLPFQDRRLGDKLSITYLHSLSSLPLLADSLPTKSGLLVVGDVDYGSGDDSLWSQLAHTRYEARVIQTLFQEAHPTQPVEFLRGDHATKPGFLERSGSSGTIHLATHSWFASEALIADVDPERLERPSAFVRSDYQRVRSVSPDLLCGVAFANANAAPIGIFDPNPAILTARDARHLLSLGGCDLLVLSACESNVGVRRAGQNVVTLNRAFWLAGSRSVISSLWKVDDSATRAFFGEFYRGLWLQGLSKAEALRAAKNFMQNHPDHPEWKDPRAWAGWVLYGAR